MPEPTSPPRSFTGYSVREWLARNKGSLKLLLAALFTFLTVRFGGIADAALNALVGTAVALVGTAVAVGSKMALDAVDYWLSDVPNVKEPRT